MPDDDKRRRLGDETKSRINDLSSGWTIEPEKVAATPEPPKELPPPPSGRRKPRTVPPPPPGSAERKALEEAIVDSKDGRAPRPQPAVPRLELGDVKPESGKVAKPLVDQASSARPKVPTAPPPIPRTKPTIPPPIPKAGTKSGQVSAIPDQRSGPASGPTSGPSNKSGALPALPDHRSGPSNKSGALPALPDHRSGPTSKSGPQPPIAQRLPLSPDRPLPSPPLPPASPPRSRPPAVIVDDSETIPESPPPLIAKLAVPVGEFDTNMRATEEEKLRVAYAQSTLKRDAAEAILGIPSPPRTIVRETPVDVLLGETAAAMRGRGDSTNIDPKTVPFERGDPTSVARPDATAIQPPSMAQTPSGGTLRNVSALRRQRGVLGDVLYVSTALLGMRHARGELAELEKHQQLRQAERRRHLVTLGRTAVIADSFDHPALGKARDMLGSVEEERSHHAGSVAAADAELERVRRDREAKAKQYIINISALDAELATISKKLEPLEKEAAHIKKRAGELRDSIRRIEKAIADSQASLVSVKSLKQDRAGVLAEIATHKADLKSVQRDEPVIAAELDALNPRIAAHEAARGEATKKKLELQTAETEDQRRTSELLEAIGAKRKVVDRAAGDAEAARDRVLFELGDRLYVDRPAVLTAQLAPVDQIDLELGESDRRAMELREILSNIDRPKLFRGIAVIATVVLVFGGMVAWFVYMLV